MTILVLIHSPFRMWTIPDGHVARLRQMFPRHTFLHAASDEEGVLFWCKLDASGWSPCGPTVTYSNLANGAHSFHAAAQDGAPAPERQQLQFSTPGGTRIIWVFDPGFEVKGTLP